MLVTFWGNYPNTFLCIPFQAMRVIKCRGWWRAQFKPDGHGAYLGKWAFRDLRPMGFTVLLVKQVFKVLLAAGVAPYRDKRNCALSVGQREVLRLCLCDKAEGKKYKVKQNFTTITTT